MGKITWKTANGISTGRVVDSEGLSENERLVQLDNGKMMIVGASSVISEVADVPAENKKIKSTYRGARFGEGNRVIPDLRTEINYDKILY